MSTTSKTSLDSLLEQYSGGGTVGMQGVNAFLKERMPGMLESLLGTRGGGLPGYEDIYSNFSNVIGRDLDRRLAGMRETYGTLGARYSSDLARQSGQARTEATERLVAGAGALRSARASELGGWGQLALGAAGQQQAERADAMALLMTDYLRKTGMPESLAALANFALGLGGAGQPTTVIS